jgi:phospholipid/cholesterol/gamma-HCH transport system substrate-binding protein
MENRAYALAAGAFTLVLTIALVAAVFWIRAEPIAHDTYVLHTKGSVSGLNVQAPVRYRGVHVGNVESIAFDPNDTRTILVGIVVRSGTPLTLGSYAQLASQGITGLSYVQLSDDGSTARLRDPSDSAQARIDLRPSFLERVSGSGEDLLLRFAALTERLEGWLSDDNRRQLVQTLTSLESAARGVSELAHGLQASAQAMPALAQQAGTTLKNADVLMAEARSLAVTLAERTQALDRVAASAERISAAAEQLSVGAGLLTTRASRETLPKLDLTLDEIRRSARSLEQLVAELSAQPSSLVFGRSQAPPGPGEPGFVHGAAH